MVGSALTTTFDLKTFSYKHKDDMPMVVIKKGIKQYLKRTVVRDGQLYGLYEPESCKKKRHSIECPFSI